MIKKLKKSLKTLKETKEFKKFKEDNPDSYLASCVIIINDKEPGDWQVDYYQPKKHKMTTFILKEKIELSGEDDIFQKHKSEVKELNVEKVKINLNKMLNTIEDLRKEKYPGEYPNKIIAVLQNQDGKIMWNITHLTSTLKIWNIKLDAEKGKVVEEKLENVFSMKAS
ncbi:MAG: hypothetical protein KKA79_03515 [Nanoarchaeota archaeon]|nr:hypothetical protein [Nanoarchaeota archaeon]MCG2717457.1 hypothetical protein [Nanoarchaeota archaeon]